MWTHLCNLPNLTFAERSALDGLPIIDLPLGHPLFHAGDHAQGFMILLEGRVEVFLTGPNGREMLLYAVEPGQSCIQTTLGLIGDEVYSGTAQTTAPTRAVMLPRGHFLQLMDESASFRGFVFKAFGARLAELTRLLERVAFQRVESRLAAALLELTESHEILITQEALAVRIGSAREVVSRRLDALARLGLISTARGRITLHDRKSLADLATDVT